MHGETGAAGTTTATAAPAAGAAGSTRAPVTRRAAKGAVITLGGYAAASVIRLGGNLVLTRLLFPEAFGLMAIVNSIFIGLSLVSDVGISHSVIQNDEGDDPEYVGTAWTIQAVRGLLLGVACVLLAAPLAAFYASAGPLAAELERILPIVGIAAAIEGLLSMKVHLAKRHVDLGRITLLDLAASSLSLALMVALAWRWHSVWALVAGSLSRSVLWVIFSHLVLTGPAVPPRWSPSSARALLSFGKWIMVSTLFGFLAGQADKLILGKLFSDALGLVGIYGVAAVLAAIPTEAFLKLAGAVVFPVLSRLRGDEAALRRASQQLRTPVVVASGSVAAALIAGGGPALVSLMYDARWQEAGWMLQLLAVGGWFKTLDAVHFAMLQALGRTRSQAASNGVRAAGTFVLAGAGWLTFGFVGAIVGLALADVVKYLATVLLVGRARSGEAAWRGDVAPTLRVALSAAAGWLAASWAAVGPCAGHPFLAGSTGAAVALACWAAPAVAWLRERAAASATSKAAAIAGAAS